MPSTSSAALDALLPDANTLDGSPRAQDPKGGKQTLMRAMQDPQPTSMLAAVLLIGLSCGTVAFLYSSTLNAFLLLTWGYIPNHIVAPLWRTAGEHLSWWPQKGWALSMYVLLISTLYGLTVGVAQRILGSPGDLPETIGSFHKDGYVPHTQAPSMLVTSLFSVTAGGSLGPEAPLLTLCASTVTYIFKEWLHVSPKMLRYCSLLGMSAGLAAFFGVSMGGTLFAMEVLHRMGLEYFEVILYTIAAGVACLTTYRGLALEDFGEIWDFPMDLRAVDARHALVGAAVGVLAAGVAIAWTYFTKGLKKQLARVGLDEHAAPVACGVLGGFVIGVVGVLLPPTMFWGEFEMDTLADDTIPLPHIWPGGGFWGHHPFMKGHYTMWLYALIGVAKLFAITVTLLAGFRGGFIFPLFTAGTALGTALQMGLTTVFPMAAFPPVLFAMTFASGLNTAITRTPLATPLILTALSGQLLVAVPTLAAACVALLLTQSTPFIMTQQSRGDVQTPFSSSSKGQAEASTHTPTLETHLYH